MFAVLSADADVVADPFVTDVATDEVTTSDTYIDVVYTGKVGANPQNALKSALAMTDDLPIIAVAHESRVALTSANDELTVDVESQAPAFGNPSPAMGDATGDEEQVLTLDVTDADLAGVDQDTIVVHARIGPLSKRDLSPSDTGNFRTGQWQRPQL